MSVVYELYCAGLSSVIQALNRPRRRCRPGRRAGASRSARPACAMSSTRSWFFGSRAWLASRRPQGTITARFLISLWCTAPNTWLIPASGWVSTKGLICTCPTARGRAPGYARAAAPVADRARVEGHQVGQPDLDLVHREADDRQRRAVHEQAVGGELPGAVPEHSKMNHWCHAGRARARRPDRRLDRLGVVGAGLSVSAAPWHTAAAWRRRRRSRRRWRRRRATCTQ